jgi:hypothetical protein
MNYEGKVGPRRRWLKARRSRKSPIKCLTHQFTSQGRGSDASIEYRTVTLAKGNKMITVQEHNKDAQGAEHDQTMVYVRQ